MVILRTLQCHNFHNVMDAIVPLAEQGLVIITGQNGAGKSTLFMDGIAYALYGVSLRYKSQGAMFGETPGSKVVRRGCKEMFVKLDLEVDGLPVTVVRSRGRKDYLDGLSLYTEENGQLAELSLGKSKDTQEVLNRLIGLGPRSFCRAVILTSEVLNFPQMPDSEKKKIMNELLDLAIMDDAFQTSKDLLDKAEKEDGAIRGKTETVRENLGWIIDQIIDLTAQRDGYEAERGERSKAQQEHVQSLRDTKQLKASVKTAEAHAKAARQKAVKSAQFLTQAETEIEQAEQAYNQQKSEHDVKVAVIQARQRGLEELIATAQSVLGDDLQTESCPICQNALTPEHMSKLDEERRAELERLDGETQQLFRQYQLAQTSADVQEAKRYLRQERLKAQGVERAAVEAEAAVSQLRGELAQRQQEVVEAEAELKGIQEETNPYTAQLTSLETQKATTESRLASDEVRLSELSATIEQERTLVECFGPKGARILLLNDVIPFLNLEAERIRELIQTPISIRFRIRSGEETFAGKLEVAVDNPEGAESYEGDSGGEKGRVDLMILFSLLALASSRGRKSVAQSFFDEAFEKQDQLGQRAVAALLRDTASQKSSVFVLSHSPLMLQADQEWRVAKGGVLSIGKSGFSSS